MQNFPCRARPIFTNPRKKKKEEKKPNFTMVHKGLKLTDPSEMGTDW